MLNVTIAVPPGGNVEGVAYHRLLHEAHIQRLHLARPIEPTISPISQGFRALAEVMGLEDEGHDFYKVECATEPCPPTS